MTTLFRLATFVSIISVMFFTGQVQAKNIMCWINDIGIRECGRVVPPEYSQSRIEVVNDRGLVVEVIEAAKTPEELAIEKEREQLRKLREAEQKEQERQDNILLNTYTTERDLILARDNNLKVAQGQIEVSMGNLKLMQGNLADLQEQAANHERAGRKPPQKLVDEINKLAEQIKVKERHIDHKEQTYKEMEDRFARDLKRFRELKSGRVK
jgi:hypothetical protein